MTQIKYTKGKQSKLPTEFFLHYIGTGLYNIDVFEREAKRFGVQRAIPFTHLKRFSFGTPVLLARFIKSQLISQNGSTDKTPGQAEIFGYFTVDGISHTLGKDLSQQLSEKLNIIKVDDNSFSVSRVCGSYSVGSVTYIKETLPQLAEKIEEIFRIHNPNSTKMSNGNPSLPYCVCEECQKKGFHKLETMPLTSTHICTEKKCACCTHIDRSTLNHYKFFLNGHYTSLTPFLLSPAKFARGIIKVKIEDLNLEKQKNNPHAVVMLYNYRQRHYLNSSLRSHFENNSKNNFIDSFNSKNPTNNSNPTKES